MVRIYMAGVLLFTVASLAIAESVVKEEAEANGGQALPNAPDSIEKKYDRFPLGQNTTSDFIGEDIDLTGAGHIAGGPQFGTLVSNSFFLTAWHARPPGEACDSLGELASPTT